MITKSTPICVLVAIARARGIAMTGREIETEDIERIEFKTLQNRLIGAEKCNIENNDEWTLKDRACYARYVNIMGKWRGISSLRRAVEDIKKCDEMTEITFYTNFGPRTNDNPLALDEITLYNHLTLVEFPMSPNMTFVVMTNIYTFLTNPLSKVAFETKLSIACFLYSYDSPKYERNWVSNKIRHDQVPIEPKNSNEAFYCFLSQGKDYSLANSPIMEYMGYQWDGLIKVRKINPHRLEVGNYFNPLIPEDFYPYKCVIQLADMEGIDTSRSYDEIFNFLLSRALLENFYFRLQPEVKNTQTMITMEELSEVDPYSILSFGKMAYTYQELVSNEMHAFTIDELAHAFKSEQAFINTFTRKFFPDYSIDKLSYIATAIVDTLIITKKDIARQTSARELLTIINQIKAIQGLSGKVIQEWLDIDKGASLFAFELLLETAMYMRGWEGPGNLYPLVFAPEGKDQLDIDIRVSQHYALYNGERTKLGYDPNNLPLLHHNGREFIKSSDKWDGLTIGERLDKVEKGLDLTEMSSCIRLSSNWFISTAYYYLQLMGHPPSFNIEIMSDVG